jgi:hypothetical protein
MQREAHIPILLWVSTALVVHALLGGGAEGVKEVQEHLDADRASIRELVHGVRQGIGSGVTEVELLDSQEDQDKKVEPVDDKNAAEAIDDDTNRDDVAEEKKKPPPPPEKKPDEPRIELPKIAPPPPPPPEPEAKKEEPKKEEEKKEEEKKAEAEPLPAVPLKAIAVMNSDPNKKSNENSNRIANVGNTVDEEQQARLRALDRNEQKPQPGTNANGPSSTVGDSEHDKSGQSEAHAGDTKRAPGEGADHSEASQHEAPQPPQPATVARSSANGGPGRQAAAPSPASKGSEGGSGAPTPDGVAAANGGWSLDPANPGGSGGGAKQGKKTKHREFVPGVVAQSGLLAASDAGGPVNLGWQAFEKAVGAEKLAQDRAAVGAAIRAEHAGRYDTNKFERWRPAIENYDPSVKLGDENALNAAEVPFADYLVGIHNRLHPIFGDEFLGSGAADSEGLADQSLVTHVEVVLDKSEGKIVRMGVTKRSGSTIFDAVALESLDRASPFGKAPDAIVSPDGNVYLHWEFHRDPFDACSTRNAHPILMKHPPKLKSNLPVRPKKPGTKPSREGGRSDDRNDGPLLPLRKK